MFKYAYKYVRGPGTQSRAKNSRKSVKNQCRTHQVRACTVRARAHCTCTHSAHYVRAHSAHHALLCSACCEIIKKKKIFNK